MEEVTLKDSFEVLKKHTAINFLLWCNTPMCRVSGELGFRLRVCPQFPEYDTYLVIDEKGESVFPKGKFLTAEELYEYYLVWFKIYKQNYNYGN